VIAFLYELITGKPWITVRSAAAEFGPPPGALLESELAAFSDAALVQFSTGDVAGMIRAKRSIGARR
jgi:hypothetical protein